MPEVKRIDSNNSKIKHTDELRAHLLDREGNKIPYSVFGTDTTRTEIISQADGTGEIMNVGFTDRSGRPQAFGNDVTDYVQALESALDETLNDGDFIDGLNTEVFPCEQRPFATLPTPIYRETLTDRTVRFLSNGVYNPAKNAPTTKVKGGQTLMVNPVIADKDAKETGILCSAITHVSDFAMMGGWTGAGLMATATDMVDQYLRNMTSKVVDVLLDAPDLQSTKVGALSGKASAQADDILDAVAVNLPFYLGSSLTDYTLLVPEKYEAILNRAAQKAGMAEISELVGTAVAPYSGDDRGVIILPKKYAMLSFRSTRSGDLVNVLVTRDANRAGYDVELVGALDVMATGTVKVKTGAFDTEAAASYPLVHVLKFED
ncbi:hypothetical protein MXT29_10620 [Klebsiella pneumoniae]|uniref:hypothetical protein n=1 Tax=Klebsiella pneumoniae TaxID=573 RepID=UPI00240657AF|nr:hypothetical protein [Klebsiella pneumoniae]MDG0292928.1 hypothetical protein [Klebsiella pneumoniae]